jgi:hypothetical protein
MVASASASPVVRVDRDGRAHVADDPFLPPPEPAGPRAGARAPAAPVARAAAVKTRAVLAELVAAAAIDQAAYDRAVAAYDAAQRALGRLTGTRRAELRAVVATLDAIAARGQLVAGRLPALVLTLERNTEWWTTKPVVANGVRVEFAGSQLVWQRYAGQGLQIQWLGTFGRANALWSYKRKDAELQVLLDEAAALAAPRAGGIAWEYLFTFDGGAPPWVSGLAQGTALTAFSRGAVRLATPAYFEVARSALRIFTAPPPEGILVRTPAGAHYLQYSFAPSLRILNGFVQSLNGLFDFATLANDDGGRFLFAVGDAEARAELPAYDTGGWSRYSNLRDSDLSYHKLLRDFLAALCTRTGTADYCTYAERFTVDLTSRPVVALVTPATRPRQRRITALGFTVDKPATVSVTVARPGFSRTLAGRVAAGRRSFAWRPPKAGPYTVRVTATDPAGNVALPVTGTLHVRP